MYDSNMQIPKIEINNISIIDLILETAKDIFNPSKEELEKYHKREIWLKKVKDGGLMVSASTDNRIVAFAICEKRNDSLHIWNVGVLSDYRRLGLWKHIHTLIVTHAIENGYKNITLNTYKDKFPNMYNFVKENDYIENNREPSQKDTNDN